MPKHYHLQDIKHSRQKKHYYEPITTKMRWIHLIPNGAGRWDSVFNSELDYDIGTTICGKTSMAAERTKCREEATCPRCLELIRENER